LIAGAATVAAAPQFPWLKRGNSGAFVDFKDMNGRFSLERPKDWEVVAGAGDTVVTFLQKKREAQIVVGNFRLARALAADDVTEVFATQVEAPLLKASQPSATNITATLVRRSGQPFVVIDYERPGLKQQRERARQYSLPRGQDNFRINCTSPKDQFAKYEALFEHVVDSFRTLAPTPAQR